MRQDPTIVFCTTCKGRTQHLRQTLPANIADNADYANAKFLVLDYGDPGELAAYIRDFHAGSLESGRVVYYRYPDAGQFRMAHAKNMAHRLGILEGADVLVNLDADNFTGEGFARYVADQFIAANGERILLWANMIKEGPERTPRGISGRIAVTPQSFLLVGGYDEKYRDWSPDDKDFDARLRRLGHHRVAIDRKYLQTVPHNDKTRFREYPHLMAQAYRGGEDSMAINQENTIANYGEIGIGTVYPKSGQWPLEIRRVPTRIFGIGLHKTATTSLHRAMKILGVNSAHWENAHWARAIFDEMRSERRSRTLEHHYALCDLPIPLLFRELDEAYPGSKFILTVRDEQEWIASVRNHWSKNNRFRAAWDTDPFTHRVHRALYGQKWFDETVFLERYRRHNAEVLEYFKDRQSDLLVMNMSAGAGWMRLCAFLGYPIPDESYPRELVSKGVAV